MESTTYYVQTMPGVEEIAWLEVRDKLPGAKFGETVFAKDQNGLLIFSYAGEAEDLFQLRTVEDVYVLALSVEKVPRTRQILPQITELVQDTAVFQQAIDVAWPIRVQPARPSYRVISRLYGSHDIYRKQLGEAVERGMKARYPKWRLVDDHAQVEIWINLLGSRLVGGIRLTDRTTRHRFNKPVELKAALRPSVAAAMIHLTQPADDDIFLDPMCGSGTLVMERRYAGAYAQMLAGDIELKHTQAARKNVNALRKEPPTHFSALHLDAAKLPLAPGSVTKVATNLPFGKQISSPKALKKLYPAFFGELERVLAGNGRAIVLSSEYDLVKESVRKCPNLEILTGYSVAVLGQWGRIYIIRRN
ncbi:MAG: RNA methyltransferase [Ardenticatenaceae bacterium]|nr:RNA methyltransferase [Anaerolineales bacterium]MCB8939058.1 RNA methyltransferase [Ardenticatenaceae bacterium]MCB8974814.1 RNA methyltransferase [Ardenticatenaceae bacterium]